MLFRSMVASGVKIGCQPSRVVESSCIKEFLDLGSAEKDMSPKKLKLERCVGKLVGFLPVVQSLNGVRVIEVHDGQNILSLGKEKIGRLSLDNRDGTVTDSSSNFVPLIDFHVAGKSQRFRRGASGKQELDGKVPGQGPGHGGHANANSRKDFPCGLGTHNGDFHARSMAQPSGKVKESGGCGILPFQTGGIP